MTHNVLKAKVVIPQNDRPRSAKIREHGENENSSKFRSMKRQSDKVARRGNRRKKLATVKLRSTKLPYIPRKVLRVLEILRHEKFLDMVQKYFSPVKATVTRDSANRRSINKDSLVGEA